MAKPKTINIKDVRPNSSIVLKHGILNAVNDAIVIKTIIRRIIRSHNSALNQKVNTFTPLTNCNNFALVFLSYKKKHIENRECLICCLFENEYINIFRVYLDIEHNIEG